MTERIGSPDGESDASLPVAGTPGSDAVGFAQIRAEPHTIGPTIPAGAA